MLQAHGIAVQRGERQILSDIDLALPAGQVIGVLGANGAGKSTLLAALAGELSPSTGRITLNDALCLPGLRQNWPAAVPCCRRALRCSLTCRWPPSSAWGLIRMHDTRGQGRLVLTAAIRPRPPWPKISASCSACWP